MQKTLISLFCCLGSLLQARVIGIYDHGVFYGCVLKT